VGERYNIAVLPGDGIGQEVAGEAVRVLRAVEEQSSGAVAFAFTEHAAGAGEYLAHGDPLPPAAFDACREADAVLLGAMGLPDVRWPDGREMTPQLDLREKLQLYGGLRPIFLFASDDSPLKGYGPGEIDFLIVRESTEGLFSGRRTVRSPDGTSASDVMRITRAGSERVFRLAFREAAKRRKRVTLVDKANVLPSMVFFREVFDEVASEFPGVQNDHVYVDAAALYLVTDPGKFDVIVTENIFGDILSDLAAGLVGGMGMAPSGDIGDGAAVFQPSHGTAPDIAGKGIANPVAMVLSAAMMLDWLPGAAAHRGGAAVRSAVTRTLATPANRTPDGGGSLSTAELTDRIISNLSDGAP
jgi:3-isopropylmalate dehydrogenase